MWRCLSLVALFFLSALLEQNAYAQTVPNPGECLPGGSNICGNIPEVGPDPTCVDQAAADLNTCLSMPGACILFEEDNVNADGWVYNVLKCPPGYDPCGGGTLVTNGLTQSYCEPADPNDGGDEDPPTPPGTGSASANCSIPPSCSNGDPQLCAILEQQWLTMCDEDNQQDNYDAIIQQLDANNAQIQNAGGIKGYIGEEYNVAQLVDLSFLSDDGQSAACPAPLVIPIGNSAPLSVSFAPICTVAGMARPVIIFACSIYAGLMIWRALMVS